MIGSATAGLLSMFAKDDVRARVKTGESAVAVTDLELMDGVWENPDALIGRKGIGELYRMRRDDALGAYMDMKKSARLCTPWKIVEASDDRQDMEIAEFVRHTLERMQGSLKEKLREIMTALEFGYSITNTPMEILENGPFIGKFAIQNLKTKEPDHFRFKLDKYRNVIGIKQETMGDSPVFPVEDFIIYSYRTEFGNPYGCSDFTRCFWAWNSKKWSRKQWDIYLERFGGGWIDVSFEAGKETAEDHTIAKKLVTDVQSRTGYLHPNTYTATVHETSGRGSDVFEAAVAARNIYMARAVLLPDLLGFSGKPTGSFALGKKHFDVFLWVLRDLGLDISEPIMFEQYIKREVDWNWPNVQSYPTFEFDPLTDEDKFNMLTALFSAVEKGVIEPDLEIENAVRKLLGFMEKEEQEEEEPVEDIPEEDIPGDLDADGDTDGNFLHRLYAFQRPKTLRGPTRFERKVDFKAITEAIEKVQGAFTATWSELFQAQRRKLIDIVRKQKLVENRDSVALAKMQLPRKQDMQKSLARYMLSAYYFGALQAQQEVARGLKKNFSMPARSRPARFEIPLEDLPLDEIEGFFFKKGLNVTTAIKAAAREVKRESFFITDVQSEKILSQAKQLIFRGIKRGDLNWTEGELKKLFDGYLKTGELTTKKLGELHRIETIARTNFTSAFNEGRKRVFTDPDVEDFIVAYQYSAILDDATTDYCRSMDEKVLTKEEMNREGFPPAHFNCRSMVVPITQGEEFEFNKVPAGITRGVGFERYEEACCVA